MNYLITGSTGFIGGLLLHRLVQMNQGRKINVVLPVRQESIAREMFAELSGNDETCLEFVECSLENITADKIDFQFPPDYIIHCAAPTASSYMISNPVETVDSIVLGTRNILELARRFHVKSMVYLSSMEVYGVVADIGRPRREDELGNLDLTLARSCYPMGKRMAEHYCHIYQQEYGVSVKIARLAQTFGKGVRQSDNRVYMQFARSAVNNRDIILKTQGLSMGNYCASEDVADAILVLLERGVDGETYNVVNEADTMSIKDMAELVAKEIAGGKIRVRIESEDVQETGYAPDTGLRLSGKKMMGLDWCPAKGMAEMYRDVIADIKGQNGVTERKWKGL